MKPVMYIIANRGLGMSPGKLAAQVAHAAVEAYRISAPEKVNAWYSGKHFAKIVLQADDEQQLINMQEYLEGRGFKTSMIVDEGRTEIKPFTKTALGIEIVDKADQHVLDSFESFSTFKGEKHGYHVYSIPDIPLLDAVFRIPDEYLSRKGRNEKKKWVLNTGR